MTLNAPAIRPLVAGNWKMNGLKTSLSDALAVAEAISRPDAPAVDVMVCPPASLLMVLREVTKDSALLIGAQDCHWKGSGANTGDISAEMLRDAGASAVILGHSERRSDHGELDRCVRLKAAAAYRAGLNAIVCIGETLGEREAGLTLRVVERQLAASLPDTATPDNTIIAYEPVWAIGTGVTPSPADVADVHRNIRACLKRRLRDGAAQMRILYGGSVSPENAAELMQARNVDGALVGGASLKARDFLEVIRAFS